MPDWEVLSKHRKPMGTMLVNGANPDKICVAEGCDDAGKHSTLTGLLFCMEHWSQWYSPDTPKLKTNAIVGVPASEYFNYSPDIDLTRT